MVLVRILKPQTLNYTTLHFTTRAFGVYNTRTSFQSEFHTKSSELHIKSRGFHTKTRVFNKKTHAFKKPHDLHSFRYFSSSCSKNSKKTVDLLTEEDVKGKHVLVRCDFNVPLDKLTGEIADDTRIREAIPTIKLLREKGAKVVLCSHMGRPKGKIVESLSLVPVSNVLPTFLGCPVTQTNDCVGEETVAVINDMSDGDVVLMENLRFHAGETKNDPDFAHELVKTASAEVYVNDAFGCAHRAHSSTAGVCDYIKGPKVAGLLLSKEIDYLSGVVNDPKRPFTAIVGGAKVSTKINVLEALVEKTDILILGGAMIFTFLKAQGLNVGSSMVEENSIELATKLMETAKAKGVLLYIPEDVVAAAKFSEEADYKVVNVNQIPEGWIGLDIGPKSASVIEKHILQSKTIVWNGPMGVFEWKNFEKGTFTVAKAVAEATDKGAVTIVGGGDSVLAVGKCGVASRMSHISTGGGASLELLEGLVLPGVAALDNTDKQ